MQVVTVVGIVSGIGFLAGALYKLYKMMNRVESAIGVDENGRSVSERVARMEYQLWENGGESLKDKVNENTALSKQTATEVQLLKEILLQYIGGVEKPKRTRKPAA